MKTETTLDDLGLLSTETLKAIIRDEQHGDWSVQEIRVYNNRLAKRRMMNYYHDNIEMFKTEKGMTASDRSFNLRSVSEKVG